jgi:hypothetical protein
MCVNVILLALTAGCCSFSCVSKRNRTRTRRIFRMTQPIQNPTTYARPAASCEMARCTRGHRLVGINQAGASQMAEACGEMEYSVCTQE